MASPISRKTLLMQGLKEMRSAAYAVQFCSLLLETLKRPRDEEEMCKSGRILRDIKEIFKHEPVEELWENILKSLQVRKEALKEEDNLIKYLLLPECEVKPTEYLNRLIKSVESLVEKYFDRLILRTFSFEEEKEKKSLRTLKKCLLNYGRRKTKLFFHAIYRINIENIDFSLEEKKKTINIVIECMPYIGVFFRDLCFDYIVGFYLNTLQKRSALQFIKELLDEYSAEHEILKKLIDEVDDIMTEWDGCACWSDKALSNYKSSFKKREAHEEVEIDSEYYQLETLQDFIDAGGNSVPEEHFWWQKYRNGNPDFL